MPDLDDNYKAEREEGTTENEEAKDESGGGNRPAGTRQIEDSTGINADAEKPIVEDMPTMPPA